VQAVRHAIADERDRWDIHVDTDLDTSPTQCCDLRTSQGCIVVQQLLAAFENRVAKAWHAAVIHDKVRGDVGGHEVGSVARKPEHAPQRAVTKHAARVVAVGMREQHVPQRHRRQRALTHVEAHVELGHLQIRREA
jgi:hypothetical protein